MRTRPPGADLIDRVLFILGEALTALRRNLGMTFAAVSTVALSLFVLGGLGLAYLAVAGYARTLPGRFEMRAYLKDGARRADVGRAAIQIRAIPGVAGATWIPREAAWKRFAAEKPALARDIENPFPEGFRVTIVDLSRGDAIARRISELPLMDPGGVTYFKDEARVADDLLRVLRWTGSTVGALLALVSGVLIFNAIRLAMLSRRLEVRVMQLVGASPATVFSPFLIEGIVQGALGGVLAGVLLQSAHIVLDGFVRGFGAFSGLPAFPTGVVLGTLAGIGGGYGLLCSTLALVGLRIRTR